jgi:Collagen triple helix repeat (20 copies)
MFSWVWRRLTYANVLMTFALVFAMSGGAYAAKHYLITSTKQISPKVLKALQGKSGPAGKNGTNGANGAPGEKGAQGSQGSAGPAGTGKEGPVGPAGPQGPTGQTGFTETLPSKKTEIGDWSIGQAASESFQYDSISFVIPLESAPIPVYVMELQTEPTHCPGTVKSPTAEPGYLCVYAGQESKIIHELVPGWKSPVVCSNGATIQASGCAQGTIPGTADRGGFDVTAVVGVNGYADGTWAVTAE